MQQKNIVFIGFGDIASRVCAELPEYHKTGVARSCKPLPEGVDFWQGAADDPKILARLAAQDWQVAVITLTPDEFTDPGYRQAYVDTLDHLTAAWRTRPPRLVLFVSSTSVYSQSDGSWVDEDSITESSNFSGQRILEAEQVLRTSGMNHVVLRCAGIYGPKRDFLLRQVRAGKGGSPDYTNRIHVEDCAGFIAHLVRLFEANEPISDTYLVCDNSPAPGTEVRAWLAERLGLSAGGLIETASARGGNKRCANNRLLSTGYQLRYPDYQSGYREQC